MKEKKEIQDFDDEQPDFKGAFKSSEGDNFFSRVQKYAENNGKKLVTISLVIIIATVLVFFIKNKIETSNLESQNEASVALSRILPHFEAGDFQTALAGDSISKIREQKIIGLLEIVDKYGSTPQGKVAALYVGNSYVSMNNFVEAEKYFDKALGASADVVLIGANSGMGICKETAGKYEDAIKYYDKAQSLASQPAMKNRFQYFAALNYEKLGNKEKAEKIFRDIVDENKSEFVGPSKSGLVRLGTIIE